MTPIEIKQMSQADKLKEAIGRSSSFLAPHLFATVKHFFDPGTLAAMAAGTALLVAAQAFGVGEVADVVIILVGAVALGSDVISYLDHLIGFGNLALNATRDEDFTAAGEHFAKAVILCGATVIEIVLLMKVAKGFTEPTPPPALGKGQPAPVKPGRLEEVGPDPDPGALWSQPKIAARNKLNDSGANGKTSAFGEISYRASLPIREQMKVLDHELVHRLFSPRLRPLRRFRARLNMSSYNRSALIRYVEEAMAEGYSLAKANGLNWGSLVGGLKFPISNGYVTVEQMMCTGAEIGIIWIGAERIRYSVQLLLDGPPEFLHGQ